MTPAPTADDVLDAALALSDEIGWPQVTAHAIGARLGQVPDVILDHYDDLDGIADAWFRRALAAAAATMADDTLPFDERLAQVFGRWLEALAPHRQASLDMLRAKLYPSHPHHWVPLVFSLSRLVQWMLDVAGCPASGRRRQATEIAVSALVPVTLWRWRRGGDAAVKAFVANRLSEIERRLDWIWPAQRPVGARKRIQGPMSETPESSGVKPSRR